MMIIVEERTFVDAHGVEVFSRWWPMDDPHGVVLVAHGASEHAGRYDRFAGALNGAGFAVVALDHRGHGRTAPSTAPGVMGPGGGDAVVDDLHELRSEAASRFGIDVPVHLFGHSMGSLIALAYLTRHSEGLAASVLCGFPVDLDGAGPMGEALQAFAEAGLRDQPAESLLADNNKPFEPGRTSFDWLSRDPHEVDRYIADPMCGDDHPLTYGYLIDLIGVVVPAGERLGAISCPVLVIAGDQDPAAGMGAHPTALAEALRAAGVGVDLTLYEGARHELLNETNREEVTADVIAWLRARPPAP
jgi:alpha-beta hydrolase superfamily lysophospholipase